MTDTKNLKPIFVTKAPESATLVGRIEEKESLTVMTSVVASPQRYWEDSLYGQIKESLANRAAEKYATSGNAQMFLVETANSGAQFDVAGIRYQVVADVYRL